jgi:hypothetical protein
VRRLLWLGIVGVFLSGRVTAESNCSATTFVQPASFLDRRLISGGRGRRLHDDGEADIVVGLTQSTVAVLPGDGRGRFRGSSLLARDLPASLHC